MPDWERFNELVQPKPRSCALGRLLAELPEEGRAAVERELFGGTPLERIREALRVMRPGCGVPSPSSFERHRGGHCGCPAAVK
jgi:hypothetical protein